MSNDKSTFSIENEIHCKNAKQEIRMDLKSLNPQQKTLTIHVTDTALLNLLLAGMESYRVKAWGKSYDANRGPAETAGLLWGYSVVHDEEEHVVVEHATTDKFARGTVNDVGFPVTEVTEVKQKVVASRWPYLSLAGDFHTHVYEKFSDVTPSKGWEFSDGDRTSYRSYTGSEGRGWEGRMALVLTIAELEKYHKENQIDSRKVSENVVQFQLDRYRYWIAGYAIDRVSGNDAKRTSLCISPSNKKTDGQRPHVYLDVPTANGIKG